MSKNFGELFPETMQNFNSMVEATFKESELEPKTIELLFLAFGIAKQCEACIDFHMGKLVDLGVTENEIATVIAVAAAMSGGPGTVFGGKALAAFYEKTGK